MLRVVRGCERNHLLRKNGRTLCGISVSGKLSMYKKPEYVPDLCEKCKRIYRVLERKSQTGEIRYVKNWRGVVHILAGSSFRSLCGKVDIWDPVEDEARKVCRNCLKYLEVFEKKIFSYRELLDSVFVSKDLRCLDVEVKVAVGESVHILKDGKPLCGYRVSYLSPPTRVPYLHVRNILCPWCRREAERELLLGG